MSAQVKFINCHICHKPKKPGEALPAPEVRIYIVELIKAAHPDWSHKSIICFQCLNQFRHLYLQSVQELNKGELLAIESDVVTSLKELATRDINEQYNQELSFGEQLADKIASFGGSWAFIITFVVVIVAWMMLNTVLAFGFDPYPYILLNLVLSTLAAFQAPVIMMSQRRQESKDRLRSENDHRVGLKAELEIRLLDDKLDNLLRNQWRQLLEIQEIQISQLEEISKCLHKNDNGEENGINH